MTIELATAVQNVCTNVQWTYETLQKRTPASSCGRSGGDSRLGGDIGMNKFKLWILKQILPQCLWIVLIDFARSPIGYNEGEEEERRHRAAKLRSQLQHFGINQY